MHRPISVSTSIIFIIADMCVYVHNLFHLSSKGSSVFGSLGCRQALACELCVDYVEAVH